MCLVKDSVIKYCIRTTSINDGGYNVSKITIYPGDEATCPSTSDSGNLSSSDASMFAFTDGAWGGWLMNAQQRISE